MRKRRKEEIFARSIKNKKDTSSFAERDNYQDELGCLLVERLSIKGVYFWRWMSSSWGIRFFYVRVQNNQKRPKDTRWLFSVVASAIKKQTCLLFGSTIGMIFGCLSATYHGNRVRKTAFKNKAWATGFFWRKCDVDPPSGRYRSTACGGPPFGMA